MSDSVGGKIIWDLDIDADKFNQGLNAAKNKAEEAGTNFKQLGEKAIIPLGVGFAAVTGVIYSSIKAATDYQDMAAQLGAVLKSTGGAVGLTKNQLLEMADALQNESTFGNEAITGAENLLLTFTSIGKDVFPQATKTVLDMSQALGQDLKSSSIQLGKALNDPVQGVTALRRVGVSFNEQQLEQIKTMQESGNLLGAQKIILAELGKEFGGSAYTASQTFAGQMKQLNNNIGDLQRTIGEGLLAALSMLPGGIQGVNKFIVDLNNFLIKHKDVLAAVAVSLIVVAGVLGALFLAALIVTAGAASAWVLGIGAIVVVVAFVATMIAFHWSQIVERTKSMVASVTNVFKGLSAFLVDLFTGGDITATWYQYFGTTFMKVIVSIDNFRYALIGLYKVFTDFFTGGDITATWYQYFGTAFMSVIVSLDTFRDNFVDVAVSIPRIIGNSISLAINTIISSITFVAKGVWDVIQILASPFVWLYQNVYEPIALLISAVLLRIAYEEFKIISAGATMVGGLLKDFYNFVAGIFTGLLNFMVGISNSIFNFTVGVWTAISDAMTGPLMVAQGFITSIISAIVGFAVGSWNGLIGFFKGTGQAVGNAISSPIMQAQTSISGAINGIFSYIVGVWNGIIGFFRGLGGAIVDAITKPFYDAKRAIEDVANQIRKAANEINPFVKHSPSLVENVQAGIGIIKDQYKSLGDIKIPPINHQIGYQDYAPAVIPTGSGSGGGGMSKSQNISITVGSIRDQGDIDSLVRELGYRSNL